MSTFKFNSKIEELDTVNIYPNDNDLKNEPMLFSCDLLHAIELGGPITTAILNKLPKDWYKENLIIDTRIHMLMPGWFPCIPGWHHDDVPRSLNGQPNYHSPEYKSEHIACVINADVAPTEFAFGQCILPDVQAGDVYYKVWHPIVDNLINEGKMTKFQIKDKVLTYFDWNTFHQGVRAVKNGWRMFFRVTKNTLVKPKNELRKQVQVYLEFPMEGW